MNPLPLLRTLRPHQWFKNLFVLVPLVFSKNLLETRSLLTGLTTFGLFCLASGVVYLINDLVDLERDQQHPTKKNRPLASGALTISSARLASAVIGPGALLGAWFVSRPLAFVLAGYIALNLFYSIVLKHLPYLDVLSIAAGFLLRVLGGAVALNVEPSVWLLVCTGLLSSYLALGKRAHELASLGEQAYSTRSVLQRYRLPHLKAVMLVTALFTAIAYLLYTLAQDTQAFFSSRYLVATVPFPLLGLLRFYQLVVRHHTEASPTDEILRDALFLINLALYGIGVILIIYVLPG